MIDLLCSEIVVEQPFQEALENGNKGYKAVPLWNTVQKESNIPTSTNLMAACATHGNTRVHGLNFVAIHVPRYYPAM